MPKPRIARPLKKRDAIPRISSWQIGIRVPVDLYQSINDAPGSSVNAKIVGLLRSAVSSEQQKAA